MDRKSAAYKTITARSALLANKQGIAQTARELREKPHFVKYWRRKLRDPNFHAGTLGGARHIKYGQRTRQALEAFVYNSLKRNPLQTAPELAASARNQGWHVNARYDMQFV